MEVKLKLLMAKYKAKSKSRRQWLKRKEKALNAKVVRAHRRLARVHALLVEHVGQEAIDRVFTNPFQQDFDVLLNSPPDILLDTLTNSLYESSLSDKELMHAMADIRTTSKKERAQHDRIENLQARLAELDERIDCCFNLIYERKNALWVLCHGYLCL